MSRAPQSRNLLTGLALALALPLAVHPQAATDAAILDRLARQSAAYRQSLPNFTCEEEVVAATSHDGKPDWRVNFHATLRLRREPDGTLRELYTITRYLGEPIAEGTAAPPIPLYVQGGFGKGVPSFFAAGQQACYRYSISGNRVGFTGQPGPGACEDVHRTTGFALLDSDGQILHGETHLPAKEADKLELTTFAAVDYAPITFDGQSFRLPVHLYAEKQVGKELFSFEARYTHCKLFRARVTLGPAGVVPPSEPSPPPPEAAPPAPQSAPPTP